ncbi:MAG TPA: C39 family peptidase, partial [Chloroflexia bacterium]|nr:C39 family peptidase [Chloroflexia bacterium]
MSVRFLPSLLNKAQRKQSYLLALLCAALLFSPGSPFTPPASAYADALLDGHSVQPYTYATPGSATSYDIMLADGVNKDRRVASVKVDGVAFGDASARLSSDATHAAVRVTGDRYGGSSLHVVDVKTGKATQIATSKNSAEGFGTYKWSPAGNTLAFVRASPALDPARMDDAYGTIYIYSVGFEPARLRGSQSNDQLLGFSGNGLGVYISRREPVGSQLAEQLIYLPTAGGEPVVLVRSVPELRYTKFAVYSPPGAPAKIAGLAEGRFLVAPPPQKPGPTQEAPTTAAPLTATVETPTALVGDPADNQSVPEQAGQVASAQSPASSTPVTVPPSPTAPGPVQPARLLPTTSIRLGRPRSMGLVLADPAGFLPALVRQDGELYPYISWNGNGQGLLMGGSRNGPTWAIDIAGNKRPVDMSLFGMGVEAWSGDGLSAVLSDNPATRLVTLDFATGATLLTRSVGAAPKPGAAAVHLPVPYVHQVKDTAASGDGNWACGPTSVVMSLAYYGKLDPWPVYQAMQTITSTNSIQIPESAYKVDAGSAYAPYITNAFSLNGRAYGTTAADPRGRPLAGLYGTICPTGLADWRIIASVFSSNGLASQYVG